MLNVLRKNGRKKIKGNTSSTGSALTLCKIMYMFNCILCLCFWWDSWFKDESFGRKFSARYFEEVY